jgi:hypothetical protein
VKECVSKIVYDFPAEKRLTFMRTFLLHIIANEAIIPSDIPFPDLFVGILGLAADIRQHQRQRKRSKPALVPQACMNLIHIVINHFSLSSESAVIPLNHSSFFSFFNSFFITATKKY